MLLLVGTLLLSSNAAAPICQSAGQNASPALPTIHELLSRSDKADAVAAEAMNRYEWVQAETMEGSHNSVDVPEEAIGRFGYSVQNVGLTRQLLKNGTPVTAEAMKTTDKEVARIVRDGLKRKGAPPATHGLLGTGDALEKVGSFHGLHRVQFHHRSSFTVTYEGDPHRKASGLEERLARTLSGTLIFDEEDGALVSVDMRLSSDFSYLLMAKIKRGAHFAMTNTRTAEGYWFPASFSGAGDGRLFFNKLSLNSEIRYGNYVYTGTHATDSYAGKTFAQYPVATQNALRSLLQSLQIAPETAEDEASDTNR